MNEVNSVSGSHAAPTVAEIRTMLAQHAADLKRFTVRELQVFGSTVRDEARPDSDIDFLVELEQETFENFMGLLCFLEDLFGRKVDLGMKDTIRPELRQEILNEAVHAA